MKPWGISTHIDLYQCDEATVKSKEDISRFVLELCDLIKVKAWGDMQIEHFGDSEEIAGYSVVQLIETSCITGHFVDSNNSAYIDIFSCKAYDVQMAVQFTKDFFQAKKIEYKMLKRI